MTLITFQDNEALIELVNLQNVQQVIDTIRRSPDLGIPAVPIQLYRSDPSINNTQHLSPCDPFPREGYNRLYVIINNHNHHNQQQLIQYQGGIGIVRVHYHGNQKDFEYGCKWIDISNSFNIKQGGALTRDMNHIVRVAEPYPPGEYHIVDTIDYMDLSLENQIFIQLAINQSFFNFIKSLFGSSRKGDKNHEKNDNKINQQTKKE